MAVTPPATNRSIAIVGGGWAGLACALKLSQAGYKPIVFESAPEPGGRARRATIHGHDRDNGQHLMLAGCSSLTKLFQLAGIELPITSFSYQSGARRLSVPMQPGRWSLLQALLSARGFSWQERYRLLSALLRLQMKGWRVPKEQTVATWLTETKQPDALINIFWAPLCLAILNTPLEQAAMCRLAPVLRDTLGMGGSALGMIQPEGNLGDAIVWPLVNAIKQSGGEVRCGVRISAVTPTLNGYQLGVNDRVTEMAASFDHVVLALPPWSLKQLVLPDTVNVAQLAEAFADQPIATVYLGFEESFRLPAPLLQIAGPTSDDARVWAMDRAHCGEPGVIAVSISAQGSWCQLSSEALAEACLSALEQAVAKTPPCLWHKAVTVQRATYSATPGAWLSATALEPQSRLHLAGDWTHPEYPATLEAAVASGLAAAECIMRQQT